MARADLGAHRLFTHCRQSLLHPSRLNQTLPDGVPHQAGRLMSVKLGHNSGAMCGHGLEAYSESCCSLLGTLTVRNQLQDLLFAAGQERRAFPGEGQQAPHQQYAFLAGL